MLQEIVRHKREEIAERQRLYPLDLLRRSPHYSAPTVSLCRYLKREDKVGIIAEYKRRSPSNGTIGYKASVEAVSIGYMQAGASALSVLTDSKYFGGSLADLKTARTFNYCPILCKDFIIDPYQIHEARSYGADVVLLIAAILEASEISDFLDEAHAMGLETIIEVHNVDELHKIDPRTDIIGVNNRDLGNMSTSLEVSRTLMPLLPERPMKISESGIRTVDDLHFLRKLGYQGFLIGSHFMRSGDPKSACHSLVRALKNTSTKIPDIL